MGAAEQEALEHFRNGHYRGLAARIEYAAGFDVPLDIAWETLVREGDSELIHESFSKVFFEPLIFAFQSLGRAALARLEGRLKRIVIRNSGNKEMTFSDGVLTIDDGPSGDWNDIDSRVQELKRLLEGLALVKT